VGRLLLRLHGVLDAASEIVKLCDERTAHADEELELESASPADRGDQFVERASATEAPGFRRRWRFALDTLTHFLLLFLHDLTKE